MDDYNEFSKKRLLNNLEKKFRTTIIGSLAVFEEEFGWLWGHGKDYHELNDEEIELREIWNKTRTKLLDSGNSNLRAAQNELSQYTFKWNRYVTNFKMSNRND